MLFVCSLDDVPLKNVLFPFLEIKFQNVAHLITRPIGHFFLPNFTQKKNTYLFVASPSVDSHSVHFGAIKK